MGQIIGGAAKPKRCNANQLSQVPTPAAGEHILVSSDNSMNAAGQGNFDCYIVGVGNVAATALPLRKINGALEAAVFGESQMVSVSGTATDNVRITRAGGITTSAASGFSIMVFPISAGVQYTLSVPKMSNTYSSLYGFADTNTVVNVTPLYDVLSESKAYTDFTGNVSNDEHAYLFVCYENAYGTPTLQYQASGTGLVDRVTTLEGDVVSLQAEDEQIEQDIEELREKLSVTDNYDSSILVQNFYYRNNGEGNAVTPRQATGYLYAQIPIAAGDKITAYFTTRAVNQTYMYGWLVTDADFIPLSHSTEETSDYSTTPFTLTASEDGYFIINFQAVYYDGSDLNVTVEKTDETPWDESAANLQEQIDEINEELNGTPQLLIPDVVYGIVGTQLNLWNDCVTLTYIDKGLATPTNYFVQWNCTKGLVTDRCFRINPKAADIGDTSCTCRVYNTQGKLIAEKTFTIRVMAANALNTLKRTVFFGDSLGANTALQLYNNFQNSAQFTGTMPAMLGTRAGDGYNYEATGGYGWFEYATSGRAAYRIYVSGVTSLGVGSVYSDTASHYFEVREVNITDGSGNALLIRAAINAGDLVMPTGTLTKVSGTGDDTIPYTGAFQESANPLWNNGALDFANYRTAHLGLSSSEKLDAVFWQLGANGTEGIAIIKQYIENLYDAFVADNPNGLFVLGMSPFPGNDANGAGASYGASFDLLGYRKRIFERNLLYKELLNDTTRPKFRLSPQSLFIDRYYGYGFSSRAISSRVSELEQCHNNYVHPTTSGYQQLADGLLGAYVAFLTE